MNWELKHLEECCISIADGDHLPPPKSEKGVPFITISNVTDNNIDFSNTMFVLQGYYDKLDPKRKAKPGDVLYSVVGSFGVPVFIKEDVPFVFQRHIAILRPNSRIIPRFLYYTMLNKAFYMQADAYAVGAAQRTISLTSLRKMKVELPPMSVQEKIVSVLSTYDKLIENNNKRIKTLEQVAENLYKEWFVRFRFPGYENAEFEDGIPKGWTKDRISAFYETTSGGTPSRSNAEYYENGTIPWLKTGELNDSIIIDTEEYITEEAVKKSSAKKLPANVIAMAMYAGSNVGKLGYLDIEMTCSQACCVFKDKRSFSSRHYLFQYLMSIRDYLQSISFGAAQQNISQDLIKKVRIVMPDDETVKCFEEHIQVLHEQTRLIVNQNKNLTKQRDLLLPRLMSGKLEV